MGKVMFVQWQSVAVILIIEMKSDFKLQKTKKPSLWTMKYLSRDVYLWHKCLWLFDSQLWEIAQQPHTRKAWEEDAKRPDPNALLCARAHTHTHTHTHTHCNPGGKETRSYALICKCICTHTHTHTHTHTETPAEPLCTDPIQIHT